MTKKHISDGRQRKTRKYLAKHMELRAEVYPQPEPELDKADRKRQASRDFRQRAET